MDWTINIIRERNERAMHLQDARLSAELSRWCATAFNSTDVPIAIEKPRAEQQSSHCLQQRKSGAATTR